MKMIRLIYNFNMNLESIWKELDSINSNSNYTELKNSDDNEQIEKIIENNKNIDISECKNCQSHNIGFQSSEFVCFDCGFVIESNTIYHQSYSNSDFTDSNTCYKRNTNTNSPGFNKLQKMQNWYMWTNDEKNIYKLETYTSEFCNKLGIPEHTIADISKIVKYTMSTIKQHEGTKRGKVKDGIIIVCIFYQSKETHEYAYSLSQLAKKANLDYKYVSKAENIILELINNNKLKLDKTILLETKTPFDYVQDVIKKNNIKVPSQLLKQVQRLIDICESRDLLLDHTPLSIGVCCFYYVLQLNEFTIDVKMFSELYNLSVVTVIKTFNKLKQQNINLTS